MGKTTLAQLAYNDDRVKNNFEKRMWVCVSDPFDEYRIAKAIVEQIDGSAPNLETLECLLQRIQKSIAGEKFFLVLDDVWTEDHQKWESFYLCLKNNCNGSKILITTRKKSVAEVVKSNGKIIDIEELSKDDSYLMFERIAFHGRSRREQEGLKEVSEKIVQKCKGLPLAIRTIGSLLRFKKTKRQWQSILKSEMWELDENENGIFPALLLSYYDLPVKVKSCFLYCITFPKGWKFDKDLLIYLWMAQGYLGLDVENDCLNILVNRSLIIQENTVDYWDSSIMSSYKMHDFVHDMALFLSHNECLTVVEDNDFAKQKLNEKIRHLMFLSRISDTIPFSSEVLNLKKLRSFIIYDNTFPRIIGGSTITDYWGEGVPQEFFNQLTKLRSLVLCKAGGEFPKGIEKLIHLRLLDISQCGEIEKLPDTLWQLYNLQTLLCPGIKRVPEWIGKLINLRHLTFFLEGDMDPMPKEIGRLICLRTLNLFTACGDNLACLKNLVHLRGLLKIRVCEDVTDVREVEKAELDKKDFLELRLEFREERITATASENFLNAIKPPPNLEKFYLSSYPGRNALPNWIMSLRELYFFVCPNWERLPPLGMLPSLESLGIEGMRRVKRVSNEFLGVERGSAPSSSSNKLVFPKLKTLSFCAMENWEEWDYGITEKDEEVISIMPCLHTLVFIRCVSLRVVPEYLFRKTPLKRLKINASSEMLQMRYIRWRIRIGHTLFKERMRRMRRARH